MLTVDFDYFDIQPGHICLDLGCGEGRHALAAYLGSDVTVLGFDLSHADLKTAQSRITDMAPHNPQGAVHFIQTDGIALPLADQSVDRLICSEVLEHIPDYPKMLQEIRRVLKPGGTLAVSVPSFFPEWICWQLSEQYRTTPGGHIRIFDATHLRREIQQQGFEFVGRGSAHALHVPYWWLKCIYWRRDHEPWILRMYHKLLVWDLMRRPWLTRVVDAVLNPLMGKSVVMYFSKPEGGGKRQ